MKEHSLIPMPQYFQVHKNESKFECWPLGMQHFEIIIQIHALIHGGLKLDGA